VSGKRQPSTSDGTSATIGVLFAAAVAGWGIVAGVVTLVWLSQAVLSVTGVDLGYVIVLTLIAVVGSFFVAIPLCMAVGFVALALGRKFMLTKWWQWAAAGSLAGLAVAFVLAMPLSPVASLMLAPVVVLFTIAGAIAGCVALREQRKLEAA
jgi:hypothetical protein